jgi:carboxylesterase type B
VFVGQDDITLSNVMMTRWTRFAFTGDPNGGSDPAWPLYAAAGDTHLVIDRVVTTGTAADADDCGFLTGLGYP